MMVVLQRVSSASVTISGEIRARIGGGLLLLLGIEACDVQEDVDWLVGKVAKMRIFADEQGLMNRSLEETRGEALIVSQFTLHASTKKGNRPSFIRAARPEVAVPLYEAFISAMRQALGSDKIQTGEFGADMQVTLLNDGPVTIIIDSRA